MSLSLCLSLYPPVCLYESVSLPFCISVSVSVSLCLALSGEALLETLWGDEPLCFILKVLWKARSCRADRFKPGKPYRGFVFFLGRVSVNSDTANIAIAPLTQVVADARLYSTRHTQQQRQRVWRRLFNSACCEQSKSRLSLMLGCTALDTPSNKGRDSRVRCSRVHFASNPRAGSC